MSHLIKTAALSRCNVASCVHYTSLYVFWDFICYWQGEGEEGDSPPLSHVLPLPHPHVQLRYCNVYTLHWLIISGPCWNVTILFATKTFLLWSCLMQSDVQLFHVSSKSYSLTHPLVSPLSLYTNLKSLKGRGRFWWKCFSFFPKNKMKQQQQQQLKFCRGNFLTLLIFLTLALTATTTMPAPAPDCKTSYLNCTSGGGGGGGGGLGTGPVRQPPVSKNVEPTPTI